MGPLPLGEVGTAFTGGENTEMEAVPGRFYSFAMDDVAYGAEGRMLVQETENPPVEIASVDHTVAESHATVTLATSAAPGPGERLFVRYTFNNWITSAFAEASGSGTNWTAEIPHAPENAGQTCAFYTLSTTVATPAHPAADLQTLRWNDNDGTAYSYAVPGEPPPARLYINEVLSSNDSSEQDEDGDYSDWLEIWNDSDTAVNLDGWGLSDSDSNPFKWMFGAVTIQPGEFLVVWASSKNRPAVTNGNQLHASFAISAGGEELLLTQPDGPHGRVRARSPSPPTSPRPAARRHRPVEVFRDAYPRRRQHDHRLFDAVLPRPRYSIPGGFYTTNVDVALSTVPNRRRRPLHPRRLRTHRSLPGLHQRLRSRQQGRHAERPFGHPNQLRIQRPALLRRLAAARRRSLQVPRRPRAHLSATAPSPAQPWPSRISSMPPAPTATPSPSSRSRQTPPTCSTTISASTPP
jgi:hypothetical protein